MSILVVESDPTQAATIRHIVCDVVGAKLALVDSIDHALQALHAATPDLILLPTLVSPAEEAKLVDFLRTHSGGEHVETLITPVLAPRDARAKPASRGWRMWGGSRASNQPSPIDETHAFAERLAWSLQIARERRQTVDGLSTAVSESRAVEIPILDVEMPSPEDTPSLPAEVSSLEVEVQSLEVDAASLPAEAPRLAVDASSLPTEVPSLETVAPEVIEDTPAMMEDAPLITREPVMPIDVSAADRRAHRRFLPRELQAVRAARLKSGPLVSLLDVSEGGALLESDTPLEHDSEAVLEIITDLLQAHYVPFRVVRSHVAERGKTPRYIEACAFLTPLDVATLRGNLAGADEPTSDSNGLADLESVLKPYLQQTGSHEPAASLSATEQASSGGRADRRRYVRVNGPFDGCRRGVIDVPLMINNLSEGGCFVNSLLEVELGHRLTLGVRARGEEWISMTAEVVHNQLGVGFAVRFVEMPDATRSDLMRVLNARTGALERLTA